MKKENIIIYISAAVLVVSSVALNRYTKDQAYPPKIKTAEAGEFLAAANVNYDEGTGVIDIKVRTNAPDGSIVKVALAVMVFFSTFLSMPNFTPAL